MTRNNIHVFLIFLASICFFSCSNKQKSILEKIPADVSAVAIMNIDSISLKAGCHFDENGAIVLPQTLAQLQEYEDIAARSITDIILTNADYINTVSLVCYVREANNKPVILFEILDTKALEESLTSNAKETGTLDGYITYTYPGCIAMTKDGMGYISTEATVILDVEKQLEEGNITENSHIKDFLLKPHDVNIVFRNPAYENEALEYTLGIIECKTGGMFFQCSFMDKEGNIFSFRPYIHDVDRKLLSFIPSKTQLLVAFGEVVAWPEITEYIEEKSGNLIPQDYKTYFNVFSNFLTLIDGTTLLALAPIDGVKAVEDLSLNSWQALLMTHMSNMDTEKILQIGQSLFNSLGIRTLESDSTTYQLDFKGLGLTFGDIYGNLYASNYNILDGGNQEMMPEYEGKKFVLSISIPQDSETAESLKIPWGINFNLAIHHNNIQMVLRLPGATKPVLQEIIDFFNQSLINDRNVL